MKIQIPVWLTTYGTIFIIIVGSFWFAAQFVEPAPPKSITMAAGRSGGAYYHFAQEYKRALKDYDVDVEVIETAGSVENMALLQSGEADFAFMQSGIAQYVAGKERRGEVNRTYDERVAEERFGGVEALSSLYFEPLWILFGKARPVRAMVPGITSPSASAKTRLPGASRPAKFVCSSRYQ